MSVATGLAWHSSRAPPVNVAPSTTGGGSFSVQRPPAAWRL